VFNFPTLGDAYKYAAYDGLERLARRQRCATEAANNAVSNGASNGATTNQSNGAATTPGGKRCAHAAKPEGELASAQIGTDGKRTLTDDSKRGTRRARAFLIRHEISTQKVSRGLEYQTPAYRRYFVLLQATVEYSMAAFRWLQAAF
jgi:hypothetical protein